MAVRELPRRAAARHRRERAGPRRLRPGLLRPRPDLQRRRRAGAGDRLDLPARAVEAGLRPDRVLGLRPRGLPARRGDVVRRAAGLGRRRAAPVRESRADARPGLVAPHPDGGGRERVDRAAASARSGATISPGGDGSTSPAAIAQATSGRIPPADRLETNDDAGTPGPHACTARAAAASRRRSTSGTTRATSTASSCAPGSGSTPRCPAGPARSSPSGVPGTTTVEGLSLRVQRRRIMHSRTRGAQERLAFTAPRKRGRGWYYVQVKLGVPGAGPYTLAYAKRR